MRLLKIMPALFVLLILSAGPAAAETERLAAQLERLESEMAELKQQAAAREAELAELKRELQQIQEREAARAEQPAAPRPSLFGDAGRPDSGAALPDISVIGDVRGEFGDGKTNNIFLEEIELALGGFLFPDIRADVFIALHRHGDDYEVELEEAYVSFLNLGRGFAGQAGKKLVGFGKLNPIHPHAWNFANRPLVLDKYLGDHGLAGNGVNLSWLAPLPWFLQLEAGYWDLPSEGHHHNGHHDHGDPLLDYAVSGRVWSGFAAGDSGELELGLSALRAKGDHYREERDRVHLYGLDLTYRWQGPGFQRLLLRNEVIHNWRRREDHLRDTWGLYSEANWRWSPHWDIGARYDWVETSARDPETRELASAALTWSLMEEVKFRFQASHDLEKDLAGYLQFIFGIGPHAHPLE